MRPLLLVVRMMTAGSRYEQYVPSRFRFYDRASIENYRGFSTHVMTARFNSQFRVGTTREAVLPSH